MMKEVLTGSGAVIRANANTTEERARLSVASTALGGIAISTDVPARVSVFEGDAVMTIVDQNIVGTTLTDTEGRVYKLWPSGWYVDSESVPVPPFDTIVAATLPGGWAWSA